MVEQTDKKEVKKVEQPRKRIPLGTRNVLTAPKKAGFVRRFVNDRDGRVENFKAAGWSVVDEKIQVGDPKAGTAGMLGSSVNPHVGGGQRAVLMELPEEIYEEDRAASQAEITKVEQEMKRNSKQPGQDGLAGSISIS
jgi:hypothetical protein